MANKTRSPPADAPSREAIFTLLRDRRRRYLLDSLSERESPIPLAELATAVASRETETESDDVTSERIDDLAVLLHHVHLPKLDEADVIDYAPETEVIISTRTELVTPFLINSDDS